MVGGVVDGQDLVEGGGEGYGSVRAYALDVLCFFFFSSRRRHTRFDCDWSSDVCSSDLSTEMSNEMLVTASHTPGSVPSTRSIPAKKFTTLRCVTITPLGLPVEPEV